MKKIIFTVFLFFIALPTFASTLYDQSTDGSGFIPLTGGGDAFLVGSFTTDNLSHTIDSNAEIWVNFKNDSGSCLSNDHWSMVLSATSTHADGFAYTGSVHNTDNNYRLWQMKFVNSSVVLTPNTTYYVFAYPNCGAEPDGAFKVKSDSVGQNFFGLITDGEGQNMSLASSYIGLIISPQPNGVHTASTSVQFSFNYNINASENFVKVGLELSDLDGNSVLDPLFGLVPGTGEQNFTATSTFVQTHLIFWRPYLETASSTKKYGVWQSFYVVSASTTNQTLLPVDEQATTSIMSMLNVPNLLKTRVPFAYIFQIADIISNSASIASSSSASLNLSFVSSTSPLASKLNNVSVFSTSSITSLMGSTNLSIMRALLVAITYLGSGFYLFHYIKGIL